MRFKISLRLVLVRDVEKRDQDNPGVVEVTDEEVRTLGSVDGYLNSAESAGLVWADIESYAKNRIFLKQKEEEEEEEDEDEKS